MSLTPDQAALGRSHAGLRLIAQLRIFNQADFARLRQFISEGYHADVLAEQRVSERLATLRLMRAEQGRLRVHQAVAVDPHHVVVIAQTERGAFHLLDLMVEEDYPHRITAFHSAPLPVEE
ncbi:hypothetical protein FBR02_12630 [Anaerolineae bacterium CFX9]|jgi:hypothetical protein|nr:hypothetical protein [Anaerolineae bacterium CFX9]